MAITEAEAKALVEQELRRSGANLVIVDDLTQAQDFGWVFFANSAAWARSRDIRDAIPGAGAILVDRDDGSVHVAGSRPPGPFIDAYRRQRLR